jgi:NAD+ diphosphatase
VVPPADFPAPFSVDIALSMTSHNRAGEHRTDQGWLDRTWADPATRVLVLSRGRFPVGDTGTTVRWLSPMEAPDGERLFLGMRDDVAYFAVVVEEIDSGRTWAALRQVGPDLSATDAGLLVHAVALAEWHQAHRFCPRCGGSLTVHSAGHVLSCDRCGRQHFPRTDPAVIMLVTDGDRALLGRQAVWPEGRYSTLAGFVDPGESLEQAVAREVAEEVGIEVSDVTYFGNQPWPFPASLMVGFFARAKTTDIDADGAEIEQARWVSRDQLRAEVEAGRLLLPGRISISRSLIEAWYGGPLPGSW